MTLPASGTITMGNVKTELGVSGVLTLAQTSVRTLFAKPSGVITLRDGYGKSNITRVWPVYQTYSGTIFSYSYVYDETTLEPSTQSASYTSALQVNPDSYTAYSLSGVTGKTIKIVLEATITSDSYSRPQQFGYTDCGAGIYMRSPAFSTSVTGTFIVETSDSLYGTYTSRAIYTTSVGRTYLSFAAPFATTYIRIRTVTQSNIGIETDPFCPGPYTLLDIYGDATAFVYAICAD